MNAFDEDDALIAWGLRAVASPDLSEVASHRQQTKFCPSLAARMSGVAGHPDAECEFCAKSTAWIRDALAAAAAPIAAKPSQDPAAPAGDPAEQNIGTIEQVTAGVAQRIRITLAMLFPRPAADFRGTDRHAKPEELHLDGGVEPRALSLLTRTLELAFPLGPEPPQELVRLSLEGPEGLVWSQFLVLRQLGNERIARCRIPAFDLEPGTLVLRHHVLAPELLTEADVPELKEGLDAAKRDDERAVREWQAWARVNASSAGPQGVQDWLAQLGQGAEPQLPKD